MLLMAVPIPPDRSNGYEAAAERFMSARNPRRCGNGSEVEPNPVVPLLSPRPRLWPRRARLADAHLTRVHHQRVDASRKLVAAFRNRFPDASAECSAVEGSEFFGRTFDGVIAWCLMFLMPPEIQSVVIRKVARALNLGGKFLFTSPKESVKWHDALTDRESISLGTEQYQRILRAEGLVLIGEECDEGNNYYYIFVFQSLRRNLSSCQIGNRVVSGRRRSRKLSLIQWKDSS